MNNLWQKKGFLAALALPFFSTLAQNQGEQNDQSYIQEATEHEREQKRYQALRLIDAVEQGLRLNYQQKGRRHTKDILELDFKSAWEMFYLPQLSLNLTTTPQRIGGLYRGTYGFSDPGPQGSLGFGLEEFTLFDWGKQYLRFLNTKANYHKAKRNLKEEERSLKYRIVIQYLKLLYLQQALEARRKQLRHASFVYRLNREKISLRKVGLQEYYQSRAEYLKAQDDYHTTRRKREVVNENLANLIADPAGTRYRLIDEFHYTRLQLSLPEARARASTQNRDILDSQVEVANAGRDYQIAFKENLPLPKFEITLGAYAHHFGGLPRSGYEPVELVTSLNAKWSLNGPDGLFGRRRTDRGHLLKAQAHNRLAGHRHNINSRVQSHFYQIGDLENQIKIEQARTANLDKAFDIVLDNYLNRKTSLLRFQDTLMKMVESNIHLAKYQYLHGREKALLAESVGEDNLLGLNFESLVKARTTQ